MRKFSAAIKEQLQQDNISVFFLVEWVDPSGDGAGATLRHTTFPYDITINELGTFKALNRLNGIDAPKISNSIDREVYKISYIDDELGMLSWVANSGLGTLCTVYIGFINTTGTSYSAAPEGYPMCELANLIVSYKGIVDTYGYTVDTDGNFISTFECSSPMAALDVVRPQFTSASVARARNANDACYDKVHEYSAPVTIHWGSIA